LCEIRTLISCFKKLAIEPRGNYRGNYRGRQVVEEPYKINHLILAGKVRVVGENVEQGVYSIVDARKIAEAVGLDLVEISPNADPPVCRVVDYSKFKYEQKKKQKELKAKTHKVTLKEIRFGPNTDEHDFDFKLKHAINFLKAGDKVKAYVHFVGRTIVYKERGEAILNNFIKALDEYAKLEQPPKLEGKRMIVFLVPKQQQAVVKK
jgi:translation initiation factor IF-3